LKVDSTKPVTTDNAASPYAVPSANNTITLSPTDTSGSGVANTTYKITTSPGGAVVSGPASGTVVALPKTKGNYTLAYNSRDLVGNAETTVTVPFQIGNGDVTAPTVVATTTPSGWTSGTVSAKITATDPSGPVVVQWRLQPSATWITAVNDTNFPTGASAYSTLEYQASDSQNNTSTTGTVLLRIDQARPTVTATPAASYLPNSGASITLTPGDTGGSGVAGTFWSIDAGAETSGTSVPVPPAKNTYQLSYYTLDNAGNKSTVGSKTITVSDAPAVTLSPIYRFFNYRNGSHFYTDSEDEKNKVLTTMQSTYSFDGPAYQTRSDFTQPLYRFFNLSNGSHFYTSSEVERDNVINNMKAIYVYDGPTYKVSNTQVTGTVPVWRLFNFRNRSHFYTASVDEKNTVLATMSNTYGLDGPAFYVVPF
ncbi:MAG: hypothetical protein WCI74_21200, partial [Actinomycetes bacterium]